MAGVKEKLEEAKERIRKVKGILFKALDYEDPASLKREIMKAVKEL